MSNWNAALIEIVNLLDRHTTLVPSIDWPCEHGDPRYRLLPLRSVPGGRPESPAPSGPAPSPSPVVAAARRIRSALGWCLRRVLDIGIPF